MAGLNLLQQLAQMRSMLDDHRKLVVAAMAKLEKRIEALEAAEKTRQGATPQ